MDNWRIRIAILAVVLFVTIAAFVSNCSGGGKGVIPDIPSNDNPPGDNNDDDYTPSPKLQEVDQLGMTLIGVDGNTYTFTYTGQPPDINIGDILSGPENGGYLRLVTNVRDNGSQLVITTEQATIDEAIDSGTLVTSIDFTSREGSFYRTPMGYSAVSVPLTGTEIYSDSSINIRITEGDVTFAPNFLLNMRFDPSRGLTYFKGTASGDLDYDFQILATGNADFDLAKEKLVYSSPLRSFKIGPIWGAVRFDFYAGVDIDGVIDENISAGVTTSMTATVGAEYSNGSWAPIVNQSHNFTGKTINGNADGSISYRGYVRPEAIILLAGIPGPSINCEADFDLTGTGQLSPPCLVYDLAGGLTSEIFVQTDILGGAVADYTTELLNVSENIDSGSVGQCDQDCQNLLVNSIIGPSEVDGGGAVEYSVTASGDTGITYMWSCDPANKGIFESYKTSDTIFHALEVSSSTEIQIKVIVKSDHCASGVEKSKTVTIINSGCPYNVSEIKGPSMILEQHSKFYSVMVQPYSIQAIMFNWTVNPSDAGYFLSNNANIVEFFANAVTAESDITLKVDVDSDVCDRITREKQVTVGDESTGN